MTAIERWREMVLREHAQSDSMKPEPREADFWTPYARNFRTDPRREGDELLDFLLTQVTPRGHVDRRWRRRRTVGVASDVTLPSGGGGGAVSQHVRGPAGDRRRAQHR